MEHAVGKRLMMTESTRIDGQSEAGIALVREEARLRAKNQLTVPEEIARSAGLHPGTRLVFEYAPNSPGSIRLRVLRETYAGALKGLYGADPEEIADYLRQERESWAE